MSPICPWLSAVIRVAACIGAAMLLRPSAGAAQDFSTIAPKQPAQSRPGKVTTAGALAPLQRATPDDNKTILQTLKGLRLVSRASDVVKAGATADGLDLSAAPGLDDPALTDELQEYIGRPLTFGDLHAITRAIIDYLRAHHQPLVDVAVPEQDVTSGTVQIVVTEFRLGRIKVAGNRWFSKTIIKQGVQAHSSKPIDLDELKRDLDRLNRNPFRKVDAVLERGDAAGTTDIQLNVQDRFPFRVYAGFDNSGSPVTGRNHWSVGFNFGNLAGSDQQFSYQFTTGDDFLRHVRDGNVRFMAHSASYIAPLAWRDIVEVFGSYVRQVPDIGPFFGQIGTSAQIGARYIHAFDGPAWLDQDVQFGFDHKTTNNNLAFGGTQIFAASQDIDQFVLSYDATALDSWGVTTLGNDLFLSPGGVTTNNSDDAFALSGTAFAKARYVYDTLALTHIMQLPYQASWVTRLKLQWASGDLLPSEQLGGGGEDSVRGYDTRIVNGSQGLLASEELRSPAFAPLGSVFGKGVNDSAQFLVFWDYAHLDDPRIQPGAPSHFALESAGAGLNYAIGRYLDLRFDYGWQLLKLSGATKRGSQADIAITLGD